MESQHLNSNLCEECQDIFCGRKRIWVDESNDWERYAHSGGQQKSWVDCVRTSAERGCCICQILSRAVAADASLGYCPRSNSPLEYFIMQDHTWRGQKHPDIPYTIVFTYDRRLDPYEGTESSAYAHMSLNQAENYVPISIVNQNAIQHLLPDAAHGDSSTNSDQSWQCISRWMKECLETHPRCQQDGRLDWWPTRLLEVGDSLTSDDIRLIVTSETPPSGPYVTLSHCWGTAQITKLTEDSLEAMKESISAHGLPKTFLDAITAVKRLGVRYLWIDSLCIIQDSSIDWHAESSQMSEVYQNGLCNISATGANDSEGGLFFTRDLSEVSPCRVLLSWNEMEKVEGLAIDSEMWERFFIESPLVSRAWVVQERILAPRVIHFGRGQLGWECHEQEHCEAYPIGFPPSMCTLDLKNLDPDDYQEDNPSDVMRWQTSRVWSIIVRDYSKRNLTVESDKEAAISGIATRISRLRDNETLVAGLWSRNLLKELCWYPDDVVSRPQKYRAPSWSWLSVDGCINVHRPMPDDWDEILWARIDEVQVNRANHNPLAPIRSGKVRLRGLLQEIRWSRPESGHFFQTFLDGVHLEDFHARHDLQQTSDGGSTWCLLVYTTLEQLESSNSHRKSLSGYGIILSQLGSQGDQENKDRMEFIRTGAFTSIEKGIIPLLASLLESTKADSNTYKRWKEFLHRHGLSTLLPNEVHTKIGELGEGELGGFNELLSNIDFEDLPAQTITIW